MVRRLLLTALLAVLAVALPAGAQDPAECPLTDLGCGPTVTTADCVLWEPCLEDVPVVGQYLEYAETVACRPWELNWPDGNQPVTETLILDPDGCIRRGIRDVLDRLPPTGWEVSVLPSLPNLSWP